MEEDIVQTYLQSKSIKYTAKILHISEAIVRRVLVLRGEHSNQTAEKVTGLYNSGLSKSEIADRLRISKSTVASYLPYSKGSYKGIPSKNALEIRKYRLREMSSKMTGGVCNHPVKE